jgi:hypothetical protein
MASAVYSWSWVLFLSFFLRAVCFVKFELFLCLLWWDEIRVFFFFGGGRRVMGMGIVASVFYFLNPVWIILFVSLGSRNLPMIT